MATEKTTHNPSPVHYPLSEADAVCLSNGERLDVVALIRYHHTRAPIEKYNESDETGRWLVHPVTHERLSLHDIDRVIDCCNRRMPRIRIYHLIREQETRFTPLCLAPNYDINAIMSSGVEVIERGTFGPPARSLALAGASQRQLFSIDFDHTFLEHTFSTSGTPINSLLNAVSPHPIFFSLYNLALMNVLSNVPQGIIPPNANDSANRNSRNLARLFLQTSGIFLGYTNFVVECAGTAALMQSVSAVTGIQANLPFTLMAAFASQAIWQRSHQFMLESFHQSNEGEINSANADNVEDELENETPSDFFETVFNIIRRLPERLQAMALSLYVLANSLFNNPSETPEENNSSQDRQLIVRQTRAMMLFAPPPRFRVNGEIMDLLARLWQTPEGRCLITTTLVLLGNSPMHFAHSYERNSHHRRDPF